MRERERGRAIKRERERTMTEYIIRNVIFYNPDLNTSFILDTDANNFSVSAILPQVKDGI